MKEKPTQINIRPEAYGNEASSRTGIMQCLSGGGICTSKLPQP